MSGHGEFEAAAKGGAVNGNDDGLAAVFDAQKKRQQARAAWRFAGNHLAEFFDIRASHESAAATDQHDRFDFGVVVYAFNGFGNAFGHARAKSVDRRIVDGDDCDSVVFCKLNQVAHFNWLARFDFLRALYSNCLAVDDLPRDTFAMEGRIAEGGFGSLGAAIKKVHLIFPSETHAAVDLNAAIADGAACVARVGLGNRNRDGYFRRIFFEGPGRIVSGGSGAFGFQIHVSAMMLHGLKHTNGFTELFSHLRVFDSDGEGALHATDHLANERRDGYVESLR